MGNQYKYQIGDNKTYFAIKCKASSPVLDGKVNQNGLKALTTTCVFGFYSKVGFSLNMSFWLTNANTKRIAGKRPRFALIKNDL